jgi:hypothetical protein
MDSKKAEKSGESFFAKCCKCFNKNAEKEAKNIRSDANKAMPGSQAAPLVYNPGPEAAPAHHNYSPNHAAGPTSHTFSAGPGTVNFSSNSGPGPANQNY